MVKTADETNGTGGYEWEYAKKVDTRTTAQKILSFIYNPQTHAVLGRTAKSWGSFTRFRLIYVAFYRQAILPKPFHYKRHKNDDGSESDTQQTLYGDKERTNKEI